MNVQKYNSYACERDKKQMPQTGKQCACIIGSKWHLFRISSIFTKCTGTICIDYTILFSLFPSFCIFFLILLCLPFLFNLYFNISFSSLCFFLEYFLPSSSFLFITLFPYFFLFSSLHIISFSFTFPDFFHFSSFLIFTFFVAL